MRLKSEDKEEIFLLHSVGAVAGLRNSEICYFHRPIETANIYHLVSWSFIESLSSKTTRQSGKLDSTGGGARRE